MSEPSRRTIFQARLLVEENGNHHYVTMDVIEHDGKFWLVPEWFENSAAKVRKPTRMIALASVRHEVRGTEFIVDDTIPKSVFFDEAVGPELESKYGVVEAPDIVMPAVTGSGSWEV